MIIQSLDHGRKVFKRLYDLSKKNGQHYLVLDTETQPIKGYEKDKKASLTIGRYEIFIFSWAWHGESYSAPTSVMNSKYPTPAQWGEVLLPYLEDAEYVKVCHNVSYDTKAFAFSALIPLHKFKAMYCTLIGAWIADEEAPKGLKERAPRYGRYLQKTKTIDFSNLEDVARYAEQDVIATDELYQMQTYGVVDRPQWNNYLLASGNCVTAKNPLPAGKLKIAQEFVAPDQKLFVEFQELPVLRATLRAELRGFPFDNTRLLQIREQLTKDLDSVLKRVYRQAGKVFNLNSGAQLGKVCADLGLESPEKTAKGAPSYGARALAQMTEMHGIVRDVQQYKKLKKLQDVYVGTEDDGPESGLFYWVSCDGRIHAGLATCGARTGRFGCSNPNLMQIPARSDTYEIRKCFAAQAPLVSKRPKVDIFIRKRIIGKRSLVVLDYGQVELRVMCLYAKDQNMTRILRDPEGDLHQNTATEFGVTRQDSKNLNFLLIYGGGEYMLSKELTFRGMPTDLPKARAYIDRFDQVYPGVHARRIAWVEECQQNGFVYYATGRKRTLHGMNWSDKRALHKAETILSNNLVQGLAQDFLKALIVRADPLCINPDAEFPKRVNLPREHALWLRDTTKQVEKARKIIKLTKTEWILQVHDECIFTTEYSAAEEILHVLGDLMVLWHYFPLLEPKSVPLVADGGTGDTWAMAKSKTPQYHYAARGDYEA